MKFLKYLSNVLQLTWVFSDLWLPNGQSMDPMYVFRRFSNKLAKAQRRLSRKKILG